MLQGIFAHCFPCHDRREFYVMRSVYLSGNNHVSVFLACKFCYKEIEVKVRRDLYYSLSQDKLVEIIRRRFA